ncbi:MAG: hypothetical protein EOP88_11790 [Verrucomicrobiaceae bacterium]|nr:MAG: hypothetical protein EOP88_11790 [Verrucomicrobiaceae bacterium]
MMNRRHWMLAAAAAFAAVLAGHAAAQDDPGKASVGRVSVTVYYGTDGDPKVAGEKTVAVNKETEKRLRAEERLRFKSYRLLGQDVQPLLRSYESWAEPLKPSDEVLVRFEARSVPTKEMTGLDLDLWLARKKILKTDVRLEGNRPLFILGPEWRGGRLIISVALAPKVKKGS